MRTRLASLYQERLISVFPYAVVKLDLRMSPNIFKNHTETNNLLYIFKKNANLLKMRYTNV